MNDGDVERLARAVTERANALVLYVRQWLDGPSADDVVQEALVALLTEREPPRNAMAWMYRTVRNAAIDALRASQRRRRREETAARVRGTWLAPDTDSLLDAKIAEQALQRLSFEHREVVVLRIWCDLTFSEIAEVTEAGVSTVHDRYKAALGELRRLLEKPCPTKST
jgi:RNA polymerase sigma-70 factor (ECF subfamily)